MAQRRKSLSEKDIKTIMAVWSCVLDDNDWNYSKLNRFIGSITIDEMGELYGKLLDWYNKEAIDAIEEFEA